MDVVARRAKEHERARHQELDIVGMGGNGDGGFHKQSLARWRASSYRTRPYNKRQDLKPVGE
jgi:hypothetical protein